MKFRYICYYHLWKKKGCLFEKYGFFSKFSNNIIGLPPIREMELSIHLMSGTGSISITPYRFHPLN